MKRIKSYYDANFLDNLPVPTTFKTERNHNELYCSMCGVKVFVNDTIFGDVNRKIDETSEHAFLCAKCVEEFEETAYLQV